MCGEGGAEQGQGKALKRGKMCGEGGPERGQGKVLKKGKMCGEGGAERRACWQSEANESAARGLRKRREG
eukprot:365080-Chlamydomonas_euryale.AAC.7